MMQLTTSSLRLLAIGTLIALPLTGCDNKAGEARNNAEEQLQDAADKIQAYALQAAYPTPMTDEQSESLTALAGEVSAGNKPDDMSDEQAQRLSGLGGSKFQPIDDAKAELTEIQNGLTAGSGGGGLNEQQAAKAALRTEASLGMARLQLEEATRSDSGVQSAISLADAHIDAVLELQAIVAANAAYDPSASLREIDGQAQDARSRLAKHQSDVREIQKRISDLQTRIDAEVRETNRLGEQAATQREAALSAPLNTRIAKIEAAAAVARQADAHQVAAANLESQVDVLQPDLVRAQTFVLEAEGEIKDLDAARARIKTREQQVAAEGAQLQSDLKKATEAFDAVFTPLAAQFENELMPYYDAARQAAEAALRDSRGAGPRGSRASKAQQALGQILWRQSMSIESFAQLVHRVAANGKALGRGGQDAAAADALDAQAKETRDGAEAALKEALDSISNEPDSPGNQNLATMIRQSLEYITGEAVAEVRDLTDLAESVPTVAEPTVDSGEGPLGLLQRAKAILDAGQYDQIPTLVLAKTPEQQTAMDMLKRMASASSKLSQACQQQFGIGLSELISDPRFSSEMDRLGDNGMAAMVLPFIKQLITGGLPDFAAIDLESINFSYDNARTTAWTDDIEELDGQNFVLQDGQWYFEAPEIPQEAMAMMNLIIDPFVTTMENIATRTSNNDFVDRWVMVSALIDEWSKAAQDAAMKMMPQGQDPGGVGRQRGRDGGGG